MGRKAPGGQTAAPLRTWRTAQYTRLSRDDGDKAESDSIAGQKAMLEDYIAGHPELLPTALFVDDGYTGTNFDRPDFRRMLAAIKAGELDCVLVKDLSRFGRDYIGVGQYLERIFPANSVRFIAITDGVDSQNGPYDMLLSVKNVFNEQYARDISKKVKAAFHTKQSRGEFVGAFPSYGYQKDPEHHGKLLVDPVAAVVVARIFSLFEGGMGKIKIAKTLNEEQIPCPSAYKHLNGDKYTNGRRIQNTNYWTYATIHRMLSNQMYAGTMEQGRSQRTALHGKATRLEKDRWMVVPNTHQAIISPEQFARVQALLKRDTRSLDFSQNLSPFAGFLRCGDCGRAMSKTSGAGGVQYCCGSYKRYGPSICTRHGISHRELECILLEDLNTVIASVKNLKEVADGAVVQKPLCNLETQRKKYQGELERLYRLKKAAYEDYREGALPKADYLRYQADYGQREAQLTALLQTLDEVAAPKALEQPWVENLLKYGKLTTLDRATIAEAVEEIRIFEGGRLEITYTFSDQMGCLEG
ncbi:MAG: recombinase family protein [Pseudoflavonifractor sp.]